MRSVFAADACRTPIGEVKGALAEVRPDHRAAGLPEALAAPSSRLTKRD